MVGQHDPGGTDPDARGLRAQVGDQDLRCAAGQALHVVVLGDPVAAVARVLDRPGDVDRPGDGRMRGLAVLDPDEVQDGQGKGGLGHGGARLRHVGHSRFVSSVVELR